MRSLTRQQKKALKKWFDANYDGGYMFDLTNKMDYDTYEKIDDMNPTEIFKINANHYLESLVK